MPRRMGVRGFLISCATWRAISAHASRRFVRSSSARCRSRSRAIRLKSSTSRPSSSEEVAATRSLANTAEMLARNPTLLHLKELEALERIAGHGGSIVIAPEKLGITLGERS